jgi:hypothetical protein
VLDPMPQRGGDGGIEEGRQVPEQHGREVERPGHEHERARLRREDRSGGTPCPSQRAPHGRDRPARAAAAAGGDRPGDPRGCERHLPSPAAARGSGGATGHSQPAIVPTTPTRPMAATRQTSNSTATRTTGHATVSPTGVAGPSRHAGVVLEAGEVRLEVVVGDRQSWVAVALREDVRLVALEVVGDVVEGREHPGPRQERASALCRAGTVRRRSRPCCILVQRSDRLPHGAPSRSRAMRHDQASVGGAPKA